MSRVEDLFSLHDVTAVVTGGAGVLCGQIAGFLARAGAQVCIWGRGRSRPVDDAAEQLNREFSPAKPIVAETVDAGDEEAVSAALERTAKRLGQVNLLVNGAGGNMGKTPFVDVDIEKFRTVVENNLLGGLVVPTKAAAQYWIEAGIPGSIINLASMTSYMPLSGTWAYGAAKSGVLNLTYATAKEFAPHGIRVNGIAPGFFVGEQNKALLFSDFEAGELTDRGRTILDRTPFARFGKVEDLEGTTLFLASSRASGFLTGVVVPVDGGYLVDSI